MDPLELYARSRDGGTWLELAVDGWRLVAGLVLIALVVLVVLFISTRQTSFFGRLLKLLRAPAADHLFLRVSLRGPVPKQGASPEFAGVASGGSVGGSDDSPQHEFQAYMAAVAPHQIQLYAKFPFDPGTVALVDPPGVRVVVTAIREVSSDPPWFSIEAEPLFRDDGAKLKYRKFIGEISHVA